MDLQLDSFAAGIFCGFGISIAFAITLRIIEGSEPNYTLPPARDAEPEPGNSGIKEASEFSHPIPESLSPVNKNSTERR